MRRDTTDRAPQPGCAPNLIAGDLHQALAGRKRAGIPMPSRGVTGLIALTLIGLIAFSRDDPSREAPLGKVGHARQPVVIRVVNPCCSPFVRPRWWFTAWLTVPRCRMIK
jgi:hypothetical protein